MDRPPGTPSGCRQLTEKLDRDYLEQMAKAAASSGGLTIDLGEPDELPVPIGRSLLERAA